MNSAEAEEKNTVGAREVFRRNSINICSSAVELSRHTFGGVFGSRTGIPQADVVVRSAPAISAKDLPRKPPAHNAPEMVQVQCNDLLGNGSLLSPGVVPC